MIIPLPPSVETRQKDYDSFTILGKRMDTISFLHHPFAAKCLGHHWTSNEADLDEPLITKLRPGLYLISSGEPNYDFFRDWGVSMPEVEMPHDLHENPSEHDHYSKLFFNGDLSDEAALRQQLDESGSSNGSMDWVANLFTDKAKHLLEPVIRSAEKGNASAIKAISYLTHHLTSSLERITGDNVKEVRKISSGRFFWPVLHTPHSEFKTRQRDRYIANIHVGSRLPVRVDRARWTDDSLSLLALELISFIDRLRTYPKELPGFDPHYDFEPQCELGELCWALPELTKTTARSNWWPVIHAVFSFSYPNPLDVREFRKMVNYQQDNSSLFKSAFLNALREKLVSLARR